MYHPVKIATCCYCGTRAALVLTGRERHELACSGCGAPLHNLRAMPVERDAAMPRRSVPSGPRKAAAGHRKPLKKKKKQKRRAGVRSFLGDAVDVIEDIFD